MSRGILAYHGYQDPPAVGGGGGGLDPTATFTWTVGNYDYTVGSNQLGTGVIHAVSRADIGTDSLVTKAIWDFPSNNVIFDGILLDSGDTNQNISSFGIAEKLESAGVPAFHSLWQMSYNPGSGGSGTASLEIDGDALFTGSSDGTDASCVMASKGSGQCSMSNAGGVGLGTKSYGVELTGLKSGTLAAPPTGMFPGTVWEDTTSSASHPILRISTVAT